MKVCVLLLLLFGHVLSDYSSCKTLTILHTNDVHARFEQFNTLGSRCNPSDATKGKCYGGFARMLAKVNSIRSKKDNVLFLNAGDYYQGTVWYTLLKWKPMAVFVEKMRYDAMSLGNHEFDDGVAGLVPYLSNITTPMLAANLDMSKVPEMEKRVKKSVVLERNGCKIGIIGYVTPDTTFISSPGPLLVFNNEIEAIKKEAKELRSQGVELLIALGHSGYNIDQDIARECDDIDLVVGGHTNTFLYTGTPPDREVPKDVYPKVITQLNGKKVPVVQDYAYGKYLGYLTVTVDPKGDLTSWEGNPILLNSSVPQDSDLLAQLKPWRDQLDQEAKKQVGTTKVFLGNPRDGESNLGNLIADSMVYHIVKNSNSNNSWSDTAIAMINSGGIRSPIDESSGGIITMEDLMTSLPFQNTMQILRFKGKHLREILEFSVTFYGGHGERSTGGFLQFSGIKVLFNIHKPVGERVVRLLVKCTKCRIPDYYPVEDDKDYDVAVTTFLAKGGDGFTMISGNGIPISSSDVIDTDMMVDYFKNQMNMVYQGREGRIRFVTDQPPVTKSPSSSQQLKCTLLSLIVPVISLLIWRSIHRV